MGMDNCFGCGQSFHIVKDCLMVKTKGRECNQEQATGLNSDTTKKNHCYALKSRGEHEDFQATIMLQAF